MNGRLPERIAQYQCGPLRAIATEKPGWFYACHCTACRRRTGTIVHTGAYCTMENVRFEGPAISTPAWPAPADSVAEKSKAPLVGLAVHAAPAGVGANDDQYGAA